MNKYVETVYRPDGYEWVITHYDPMTKQQVTDAKSAKRHASPNEAIDDCVEWMEANDVDAEITFNHESEGRDRD